NAGSRFEFVKRDDWSRANLDDLTPNAKVLQYRLEQPSILFESLFVDYLGSDRRRFRQELERRQYRLRPRLEIERRLPFLFGAPSLSERPRFGRNKTDEPAPISLAVGWPVEAMSESGLAVVRQWSGHRRATQLRCMGSGINCRNTGEALSAPAAQEPTEDPARRDRSSPG